MKLIYLLVGVALAGCAEKSAEEKAEQQAEAYMKMLSPHPASFKVIKSQTGLEKGNDVYVSLVFSQISKENKPEIDSVKCVVSPEGEVGFITGQ